MKIFLYILLFLYGGYGLFLTISWAVLLDSFSTSKEDIKKAAKLTAIYPIFPIYFYLWCVNKAFFEEN